MPVFPKTKRLLYLSILAVLATLSVGGGLVYLLFKGTRDRDLLMETVQSKQEASVKASSLLKTLSMTKDDQVELDRYVIGKDGPVSFVEMLEKLALDRGLELDVSALSVVPDPQYRYFEKVVLSVETKGSFSKLLSFITLLETLPYKVTMTEFYFDKFSATDKKAGETWRLIFTMEAYKMK